MKKNLRSKFFTEAGVVYVTSDEAVLSLKVETLVGKKVARKKYHCNFLYDLLYAKATINSLVSVLEVRKLRLKITVDGADNVARARSLKMLKNVISTTWLLTTKICKVLHKAVVKAAYHNHAHLTNGTDKKH